MQRAAQTAFTWGRDALAAAHAAVAEAEIPPGPRDHPGTKPASLHPGSLVFRRTRKPVDLREWRRWWEYCLGADWRHPHGLGSSPAYWR